MKKYMNDDVVTLRALEPEDLELLYLWENDEQNWVISHTLAPFSKHTLSNYLKEADRGLFETNQLRLMIENKKKDVVGCIDLFDFDPYHSRAGVGILIQQESDRKNGYGSHALQLMISYCFNKLNLHQLYANVMVSNKVSIKMFENLGFSIAGIKKQWIRNEKQWEDECLMQLVNSEMIEK